MKYIDNGVLKEMKPVENNENQLMYNTQIGLSLPSGYSIITNEKEATQKNILYFIVENQKTKSESEGK